MLNKTAQDVIQRAMRHQI